MVQRHWSRTASPLVIAHRGASADAPENSLLAFRLARKQAADGVELDVMLCQSGEVVVFHDDDLWRLAGRGEAVRELPLAALREVTLAQGTGIPTLGEAIEEIGPELLVNIELKVKERHGLGMAHHLRDDGLAQAVAALVLAQARPQRFLVSSFDPIVLLRLRRVVPHIKTALLFHHQSIHPLRAAWPALLLQPLALHPEAELVSPRALSRWHAAGYAVNVWTVDDPHEVAWLAALGVDGIITNAPARAREALAPLGQIASGARPEPTGPVDGA